MFYNFESFLDVLILKTVQILVKRFLKALKSLNLSFLILFAKACLFIKQPRFANLLFFEQFPLYHSINTFKWNFKYLIIILLFDYAFKLRFICLNNEVAQIDQFIKYSLF